MTGGDYERWRNEHGDDLNRALIERTVDGIVAGRPTLPAPDGCMRLEEGKACDGPADWRPVLLLFPLNNPQYTGKPIRASIGLAVCHPHKQETTLEALVTDEGFEQLSAAIVAQGKGAPDPERVGLDWERIS